MSIPISSMFDTYMPLTLQGANVLRQAPQLGMTNAAAMVDHMYGAPKWWTDNTNGSSRIPKNTPLLQTLTGPPQGGGG